MNIIIDDIMRMQRVHDGAIVIFNVRQGLQSALILTHNHPLSPACQYSIHAACEILQKIDIEI